MSAQASPDDGVMIESFGLTNKAIFSILLALAVSGPVIGVALTEKAEAVHASPAMFDLAGKKLAKGEFTQQIENNLLHVTIAYDFGNDHQVEEKSAFRQQPELIQEEWSWRETKDGKLEREFKVDFNAGTATAQQRAKKAFDQWSEQIEIEPGRTFAGFGFALALENLWPRLLKGEMVELKAVGFDPKPRIVPVKVSYGGVDQMEMATRVMTGDHFLIRPDLPAIVKLLVSVPDTGIWLTRPPRVGFLRWEGPLVEPSDPVVRVDSLSGEESGPAKPAALK